MWKRDWVHRGLLVLFLLATVSLGFGLGWKALLPRVDSAKENLAGREEMYDRARPMAANYPVFGTGPGTFETVFSLYRVETDTYWPAQLHNDWLETRITFGWAGSGLFAVAVLLILLRGLIPDGISDDGCLLALAWLAILGCLVHARFDFPFQIYSIQFLVVLLCSILSTRSYSPRTQ
jgi:O-antigen ligase